MEERARVHACAHILSWSCVSTAVASLQVTFLLFSGGRKKHSCCLVTKFVAIYNLLCFSFALPNFHQIRHFFLFWFHYVLFKVKCLIQLVCLYRCSVTSPQRDVLLQLCSVCVHGLGDVHYLQKSAVMRKVQVSKSQKLLMEGEQTATVSLRCLQSYFRFSFNSRFP